MTDPTPARPELPALPKPSEKGWIYETKQMKAYGRQCADEREAWARADERRKALTEIRDIASDLATGYEVAEIAQAMLDRKEPTT